MDKEFIETCMSKRTKEIEPSVLEILNPVVIENLATSHNTYIGNIKTMEIDRLRAETFIDKTAIPFLDEINKILKSREQ